MKSTVRISDTPTASHLAQAVSLALYVQRIADLPPARLFPPERLASHTAARQARAEHIWVALDEADQLVGHVLVESVRPGELWYALDDPDVLAAAHAGDLMSVGVFFVHPDFWGQGVGPRLVAHLGDYILAHPQQVFVTLTWDGRSGIDPARQPAALTWRDAALPEWSTVIGEVIGYDEQLGAHLTRFSPERLHEFLGR